MEMAGHGHDDDDGRPSFKKNIGISTGYHSSFRLLSYCLVDQPTKIRYYCGS